MNTTIDTEEKLTVRTVHEFDVPREQLFKAWADPEKVSQWWGPAGFTNTFDTFDLQPGGNWIFTMHGPDGTDYPNHSIFKKIEAPSRIEFDHISGHKFHVIAEFEDLGSNRSKLTWRMIFEDPEDFEKVKEFVKQGNRQNMEKLQAFLTGES
jgi:uncharacterized protein YndB with AHSA1/START domain